MINLLLLFNTLLTVSFDDSIIMCEGVQLIHLF